MNKFLSLSETAAVLDASELDSLGILLTKRPPDENIQSYTESSFLATCADIGCFFHDTWSQVRLSPIGSGEYISLLLSPEYNETSIFEVMSSLAKQLLIGSTNEGKYNQSLDDFDDFANPLGTPHTPHRLLSTPGRRRNDSIDDVQDFSGGSGIPMRQRREFFSSEENSTSGPGPDTYRAL